MLAICKIGEGILGKEKQVFQRHIKRNARACSHFFVSLHLDTQALAAVVGLSKEVPMFVELTKDAVGTPGQQNSLLKQLFWLSKVMDPKNNPYFKYVVVAGSAALSGLRFHELGEKEDWSPNDIDIFVYGNHARTSYVRKVVDEFVNIALRDGLCVTERKEKWNYYCSEAFKVLIIDVAVSGFGAKFSFVQCPLANSPPEVVSMFDMNIVRVCYYIQTSTFHVDPCDWQAIKSKKHAKISPVIWSDTAPTRKETRRLVSTLGRMRKYSRRGYRFDRIPRVRVRAHQLAANLPVEEPALKEYEDEELFAGGSSVPEQVCSDASMDVARYPRDDGMFIDQNGVVHQNLPPEKQASAIAGAGPAEEEKKDPK